MALAHNSYEVWRDNDRGWRWNEIRIDGTPVSYSELYPTRELALEAARAVHKGDK